MTNIQLRRVVVGRFDEIEDPGCREFQIGSGDWPFKGFVVRQSDQVFAYQNCCVHVGHPLNWAPDAFLTEDRANIICASHGAMYEIESGLCIAGPCLGKTLHPVEVRVTDENVIVRGPNGLR